VAHWASWFAPSQLHRPLRVCLTLELHLPNFHEVAGFDSDVGWYGDEKLFGCYVRKDAPYGGFHAWHDYYYLVL
jgi:hypothetical protein